jgi:hypothetical protein
MHVLAFAQHGRRDQFANALANFRIVKKPIEIELHRFAIESFAIEILPDQVDFLLFLQLRHWQAPLAPHSDNFSGCGGFPTKVSIAHCLHGGPHRLPGISRGNGSLLPEASRDLPCTCLRVCADPILAERLGLPAAEFLAAAADQEGDALFACIADHDPLASRRKVRG